MAGDKDYSKLTLDELTTEEKKIRRQEITSAVFIGFLLGVIVYGVATKGLGFLHIFIPLLLIGGIVKNSQGLKLKLKEIRAEISARSAA